MQIVTLVLILIFGGQLVLGQDAHPKLHNPHPGMPEMELVLLPYGADFPVKLGTVKVDGTIELQLPDDNLDFLPKDKLELYFSELSLALAFKCSNLANFKPIQQVKASNGGNFGLWYKKRWAGTVYPVSDEQLLPWREDPLYMAPVKASFIEIIYVNEDIELKTDCINVLKQNNQEVTVAYTFDLHLKKGYNFIEYVIEDIHKSNSKEISSVPSKVLVRSVIDNLSTMKWVVNYF